MSSLPEDTRGVELRESYLRLSGIPVLTYHGLNASGDLSLHKQNSKFWIPERQFRGHLDQIRRKGYKVALLHDLWDDTAPADPGARSVVLTFDDGRDSDYRVAYPLLVEAGVRAEFFVNTAAIEKPGFLTWSQICEMQRAGMSFQSHSHDHVVLTRLSNQALERQVGDSKRLLEDRLGCAVEFLAVPYGLLDRRVVEAAAQQGYRAVCTSWNWPAKPGARTVNRAVVYGHTSLRKFDKLLTGNPVCYTARVIRSAVLYLPKQLLLRFQPARLGVQVLEEQA